MMEIKVLGSGCANCEATAELIKQVAEEKGVDIQLEKIEDIAAISRYGVMSTPGVVINGQVVHAGGIPPKEAIAGWLS